MLSRRSRSARLFPAVVAIATIIPQLLLAADYSWNNSAAGSWFTPGSWSPNGTPGAGDNIISPTQAGTLRLNSAATTNGIVTINNLSFNGSTWVITNNSQAGKGDSSLTIAGTLAVTGGTLNFRNGANTATNVTIGDMVIANTGVMATGTTTAPGGSVVVNNSTTIDVGGLFRANSEGTIHLGNATVNGTIVLVNSDGSNLNRAASVTSLSGSGSIHGSNSVTTTDNAVALTITGASDGSFSGTINNTVTLTSTSAVLSLTKAGNSVQTLSGTNTYTGNTNVTAGTLRVNGSIASSALTTVSSGATLSGRGVVGALQLHSGASLALGVAQGTLGSLGSLSVGATTLMGGSSLDWNINDASGVAGTNWNTLHVDGALTVDASAAGNPFVFNIHTLDLSANTAGDAAGFDSLVNYVWTLADFSDGIVYGAGLSFENAFALNTASFLNDYTGTFSLIEIGNSIALSYTAVAIPEPSTVTLIAGSLALGLGAYAKRRRQKQTLATS